MPIPTPSIKPALIRGGTHTARYVGAIGVSATGAPGQKAQGSALFTGVWTGSPPGPGLGVGDVLVIGPDNLEYSVLQANSTGSGEITVLLQAAENGPQYHFPVGTEVRVKTPGPGTPSPGELISPTAGGVATLAATSSLHIDLTAFPERLRSDPHFVDQLQVIVQGLDEGIANVTPYTLLAVDFHGTPVIEYLTVSAVSDSDANDCVVTVKMPHSHTR